MPSFFLMTRRPPISPLFPSTPLFRSSPSSSAPRRLIFWTCRTSRRRRGRRRPGDRKSTRLNSSHGYISYAVFFFNDPAPTDISSLPLHAALPIFAFEFSPSTLDLLDLSDFAAPAGSQKSRRSEEHTSELQSRLHLLCRLFF